ncbi:MAG: Hsp20/alpha crystallin family protein [Gemmatimonadetes bacterium]|nr:Hsp20/alpha crystallin family protein [Gemmatimonadota bacterium]
MKVTKIPTGMPTMVRDIEDVFERFLAPPVMFPLLGTEPLRKAPVTWVPALDLTETEKEFILRAEVPGVPRENLDVHLEADVLTLTGHREAMVREANEHVLWEERETGQFLRNIRLPKPVEPTKVEALFHEGVLTIRLPKIETQAKSKIVIKG